MILLMLHLLLVHLLMMLVHHPLGRRLHMLMRVRLMDLLYVVHVMRMRLLLKRMPLSMCLRVVNRLWVKPWLWLLLLLLLRLLLLLLLLRLLLLRRRRRRRLQASPPRERRECARRNWSRTMERCNATPIA